MDTPQSTIDRCYQLDLEGRREESIALLSEVIATSPTDNLYYERGLRLEAVGQYGAAKSDYSNAIAINQRARYYTARGLLCSSIYNDNESALRDYERAMALEPLNPTIYIHAAFSYLLLGKLMKAIELAETSVEYAPKDALTHSCLGQCFLAAKLYNDAAAEFSIAVSINPECADNWSALSRSLQNLGNVSEAKNCIERAILLDRSVGNMISYAKILIEINEPLSAIRILNDISRDSLTEIQRALVNGYLHLANESKDVSA